MSLRRLVLDVLPRTRLLEISQSASIESYSNAPRNDTPDSASRARSVFFKELLAHLRRDELKLPCRSLELEDTGRELRDLIKRILAADRRSPNGSAGSTAPPKKRYRLQARSASEANPELNGVVQMSMAICQPPLQAFPQQVPLVFRRVGGRTQTSSWAQFDLRA